MIALDRQSPCAGSARAVLARLARIAVGFGLCAAITLPALAADEAPAPAAPALVAFTSDDGLARLARSSAKTDFPLLANQFEAQSNSAFCGPATATIVLNAVRGRSRDLPRDRSRLRADDLQYMPPGADPTIPRFTQENVFIGSPKTRAQVLGEPVTIDGKQVRDFGFQLRQLDALLRAHDLVTQVTVVDEQKPLDAVRAELVESLQRRGDYVIVNYRREAVGQRGGGHISPLGAYDAESDSFLVLDVNPSAESWVWMPTATLVKGMRTFDTVENRGYIRVAPR